jgi:biopolymer transport protein TolQ
MNITQDLSIIELIVHASLVVKLVMLLLTLVSLTSWYWIFRKAFAIRDARNKTDKFERDFWSGGDLNALYQSAVNNRHDTGALERIFEAGYREFTKLRGQKALDAATVVDGARRAMRATYQREIDDLEAHLAFLASVGSVSPYVGLFGTVWGIMHAFRGLANMSTATLSAVAPGIAEALVATAIGPLRRDSGGDRLQPLRPRRRSRRGALRELHGRVLEHPAKADPLTWRQPGMLRCRCSGSAARFRCWSAWR